MLKALHELQRGLMVPTRGRESITVEPVIEATPREPVSPEFLASLAAAVLAATARRNEIAAQGNGKTGSTAP